jgi:succinate dehydrogenase / fumarate reductase, cytochrome b subunit
MPIRPRPLSPHLEIYRWQMGNTLSILHRLSGVALSVGLITLVSWLIALASGEATYAAAARWLTAPIGRAALIGWTFAFCYHFLNGMRHLFWDLGLGFERSERRLSGWLAVIGAVALSLIIWIVILRGTP